jgi:DNA-binding NarL/FixJ family response regulator
VFHATQAGRPAADSESDQESPEAVLTDRELTILEAVASGKRTTVISKELWGSDHTVNFHLTNIYRKLAVANRASAVNNAIKLGLVGA